jgi:hypothetical protein
MSAKIFWPESQQCVGCKHGCFLMNESESSVYICDKGLKSPQEYCHEPDCELSHLQDLDDDLLEEKLEIFEERIEKGLPVDEDDLSVLKEEMKGRAERQIKRLEE